MKTFSLPVLAGVLAGVMLAAAPAQADVFSSQGFTGETTTLNALPGVNLDAAPGFGGGANNCVESEVSGFSARQGRHQSGIMTECRFGNFSITTVNPNSGPAFDTTYGGNPPPWQQGWRPDR